MLSHRLTLVSLAAISAIALVLIGCDRAVPPQPPLLPQLTESPQGEASQFRFERTVSVSFAAAPTDAVPEPAVVRTEVQALVVEPPEPPPSSPGRLPAGACFSDCFVAGTLVATPAGHAAIESLRRGDVVLTLQGQHVRVQQNTRGRATDLVELVISQSILCTTTNHALQLLDGEWRQAGELRATDLLRTVFGAPACVERARRLDPVAPQAVFNLVVEGNAEIGVGAHGIVAASVIPQARLSSR